MAVFVTTDLHGNYDVWKQIKEYLKEDDTLICLGDSIDRGGRGFEIFMEMLDSPQVVYLKGNHEQMMYESFFGYNDKHCDETYGHWIKEGGQDTLNNILNLNLSYDIIVSYIEKIRSLPYQTEYQNQDGISFILTHAGYTPGQDWNKLEIFKKQNKMLWDRDHFTESWPKDQYADTVMIHGHTPTELLKDWYKFDGKIGTPLVYENNHKINLDMGTAWTGLALMFNLDTYEYITISDESVFPYQKGDK